MPTVKRVRNKKQLQMRLYISTADKEAIAKVALSQGLKATELIPAVVKEYMASSKKWKRSAVPEKADRALIAITYTEEEKAAIVAYTENRAMKIIELYREAIADYVRQAGYLK